MKKFFPRTGMLSVMISVNILVMLIFPLSASAQDHTVYDGVEYTMENWLAMNGRGVIEEKLETNSQYSTITALNPETAKPQLIATPITTKIPETAKPEPIATPTTTKIPETAKPEPIATPITEQTLEPSLEPMATPEQTMEPSLEPMAPPEQAVKPIAEPTPVITPTPAQTKTEATTNSYNQGNSASKNKTARNKSIKMKSAKSSAKRTLTVKWNTVSEVKGYQVQYSTKKNMKSSISINVSGRKKNSCNIKNLKSGKYYYVRVRFYKMKYGIKTYGNWSSNIKVKVL